MRPAFPLGITGSHNVNAMWLWGAAANGKLGNNTTTPDLTAAARTGTDTDWEILSTSTNFSIGVRNGKLYSWGSNADYRTGLNTNSGDTLVPTQIGSDTGWTSAASGAGSGFAIRDGKLYSWGNNLNYRTGQGTNSGTTNTPTQIGSDTDWELVFGGYLGGYAIKTNGKLYAWGTNLDYLSAQGTATGETTAPTQVGTDTDWELAMSAFESGTIAAAVGLKGGKPVSWGDNANGTTGQNSSTGNTTVPTALANFTSATDWTSMAIGSSSCAGIGAGKLYTWGSNAGYRTGRNTNVGFTTTATQVGSDTTWSQATQSNLHGIGLKENKMFGWGSNSNGRTGQGTTTGTTNTPTQIGSDSDWKKLGTMQINAAHSAGIKG